MTQKQHENFYDGFAAIERLIENGQIVDRHATGFGRNSMSRSNQQVTKLLVPEHWDYRFSSLRTGLVGIEGPHKQLLLLNCDRFGVEAYCSQRKIIKFDSRTGFFDSRTMNRP